MLKIYGADLSPPSCKVRFVANYLGLTYEYRKVDLQKGENRSEAHMRLHPAGKVPVIEDDGFILFESNAIIRYMAEKAGSALYPTDTKQRAIVNQWMDFVSQHVATALGQVLFNRVFAPFLKMEVNERSIKDGLEFLKRFLPVVETRLQGKRYMAGKDVTLADFALLSTLDPAEVAGIELAPYPSIVKWRKDLQDRDFYTKCHKSYGDALAAAAAAS